MKKRSSFKEPNATQSSGFLLWQVTTIWQREVKQALEDVGLSHSGFVILASLLWFEEQKKIITQTTIIDHTKLDKMTVSKSLKSLEKEALVMRAEDKTDTRAKTITLTKKGKVLTMEAIKVVEKIDDTFFSKLNKDEKSTLNQLFIKLNQG